MTEPFGLGAEPDRWAVDAVNRARPAVQRLATRVLHEFVDPAVYRDGVAATVSAWVAGEPVPFAEAVTRGFEPVAVGWAWGRPWGTTWFRFECARPVGDAHLLVDLGFTATQPGFQAEGLAYGSDGRILKGVAPRNRWVPIPDDGVVLVEAAANPDLSHGRPTPLGDPLTAGDDPLYVFRGAIAGRFDREVWELQQDLALLVALPDVLEEGARRGAVLAALGRAVAALDPADVAGTASAARAELATVLSVAAPAGTHRVSAVGHAHIDSAWLWPTRETIRKCARTFANVLALMDAGDDLVFACSSAQQYAWIEEHYPQLFERIRQRVAEGRWVPVGGMWVESDTNMPSGESLVRQFVEGKRYFRERFGVEPLEVWLPDSFGYTAALPQIARGAGCRFMLTQKASWNDTNRMPHDTFQWEGIDGSRVLTHFPPVDTYNSDLSATDLDYGRRRFKDSARSGRSLTPFGWGDGGGGPTREMLAAAARTRSLDGLPAVAIESPQRFFEAVEAEVRDPAVWSGEIYLELHRGTYSSQARTKAGNRRSEALLHEAELWCTTATVLRGVDYPADELRALWHSVLLMQFHDILPGSSITWVHREAEAEHERVQAELERLVRAALAALAGAGDLPLVADATPMGGGVTAIAGGTPPAAMIERHDGVIRLVGERLSVVVRDGEGVVEVVDHVAGRAVVPPGARFAELQLFRDLPNDWEAWDLDPSYRALPLPPLAPRVESVGTAEDGSAHVVLTATHGASIFRQTVRLAAGGAALEIDVDADWHEQRVVLKQAFPVAVNAPRVQGEVQFGFVERPTHANTSWEEARFEFAAHRWVRIGDAGWGLAVANDRVYGHDAFASVDGDGRRGTTVRQTLLRSPLYPDPRADEGRHAFRSVVVPGGVDAAVAAGYRTNVPPRALTGGAPVAPLVTVEGAVVETVKLADDGSGDVIVRLYEALGASATARVSFAVPLDGAMRTDLLERPLDGGELDAAAIAVPLEPFRIATLRLRRAG